MPLYFYPVKLRLAISPCPNDTFAFYALLHGKLPWPEAVPDVTFADVEALNELSLAGQVDVCKVSLAVYPKLAPQYWLLRSGAALGSGCGPLLVHAADGNAAAFNNPLVAVPGKHTTADLLLSLFYPQWPQRIYLPYDRIAAAVLAGEADMGVLIHETRFTYEALRLKLHADLGQLWEQRTGLPLPLGGIVAARALPDACILALEQAIQHSVRYAHRHPGEVMPFVRHHARELDDAVLLQHIQLFVNDFTVNLGANGQQAVECLLQYASGTAPALPVFPDVLAAC